MSISKKIKSIFKKEPAPIRTGKKGDYIFIHINKTGGTSIAEAIGMARIKHRTVKEVLQMVDRQTFDNAFKFAVVRNPWSKVVSHYNYRVKTNRTGMADNPISFKDWVACTYGDEKDFFYYNSPRMFQPQIEWLKDNDGKVVVDHIIKFEALNEGFSEVSKKIGIESELPHLNATSKKPYSKYYDNETREIVRKWFQEDIDYFKYDFDME